jgi:hypothetical protein
MKKEWKKEIERSRSKNEKKAANNKKDKEGYPGYDLVDSNLLMSMVK